MNFKKLDTVIEDILTSTFKEKVIVKQSFLKPETNDECGAWYFQYYNGVYETLIEIPRYFAYAKCYTITDIEKFNKEFKNCDSKDAFLIFEKDIINSDHFLNTYQAYRFIKSLKKHGFELADFLNN